MGTGWRRAFCTSIRRNPESTTTEKQRQKESPSPSPSPRSLIKFGFRSGSGTPSTNPSTPRLQSQSITGATLRCRTTTAAASAPSSVHNSPRLHCKTTTSTTPNTPTNKSKTPGFFQNSSTPSSPKSPSRFSLFKTSLRLSKNSCGICLQSMKTGQGTAIFTAECSHSFHFPCIAAHVRKHGILVCPVCSANWREVPLLALHKNQKPEEEDESRKENVKFESPSPRDLKIKQSKSSDPKALYDDDEPLSSPTAGARFNTIPEADDENGDDETKEEITEFQGFFVDPNLTASFKSDSGEQSPTIKSRDHLGGSRNVEVKLLPVAAVVSVGRSHETYAVALKIKAPPPPARNSSTLLDPTRRAPIDLVTVLDVSGSMTGEKLQMLKRAMRLVISSLGSCDRLSIIAFASSPKRLLPLRRMSVHGQKAARRIIDRLVIGEGSSVGDALRKATKVLEDRRERNPVASIMLLSDGQEDQTSCNNTAAHQRQSSCNNVSKTRFAHLEIPVNSPGYGENGGHSQEPAEDAFAKCVGGLLSVVVQDLRLQIGFASGSAPAEIAAVYSCTGKPALLGSNSIRLGDLYAEEERELLVELKVPATAAGAHHVMSVRCCYKDPATQEVISGKDQPLLVPRPHAIRSSSPKIERLRNLFITTRAIAEARRLIEHNDLSNAYHLLSSTRALLKQSSSVSSDSEYIQSLETELTEERKNVMGE
ncbi:zinc finger protein [Macleaya cordata]|uniref:Zinc finger protein n=1 Tax=Macleaya cordata TaxID=56857 RepID=A0A200QA57_MACCD|nr:zinc finger protein [Macleaya cordata]